MADVQINNGDNAWILTATALVYLMTPGVAFFYGGMVHKKNLLGTFALSFLCMGIVTVQWVLFGYALAFGKTGYAEQLGGGERSWYALDFLFTTNDYYAPTFPLYTHASYQCAFAVITPAIITGIVVNKMKIDAFCIFTLLWTTLVYDVTAFWVWNPEGWLHTYGALDFAGGTVIHVSSGFSALVVSLFLRDNRGAETVEAHHANPTMTVVGGALLWFGWLGFNAGSAGSAGEIAALALVNTNAAAASALLTFVLCEHIFEGKINVIGGICGAVVGLVIITPAAGYVRPGWAVLMGIWGTLLVYAGIVAKRKYAGIDDPLDVFSCHGMGGVYGSLLTGLFCEKAVNPAGFDGAFYNNGVQFWHQLAAVLVVIAYASAVTAAICLVLTYTIGIKVSKLEAALGMDSRHTLTAKDSNLSDRPPSLREHELVTIIQKARRTFAGDRASLTPDEEAELRAVFDIFDTENTGKLTLPQFLRSLREMRVNSSKEEQAALFRKLDTDNSGAIDFAEYRNFFIQQSQRHLEAAQQQQVTLENKGLLSKEGASVEIHATERADH